MKHLLIVMLAFSAIAQARELTFEWDAPADPSFIDDTRIYAEGDSTVLGSVPAPETQITIEMGDMEPGRYCYVATHTATELDIFGNPVTEESAFSNTACIRIPPAPGHLKVRK